MSRSNWLTQDGLPALVARFGTVGVLATATYLIAANILSWTDVMSPVRASVLAYVFGMIVSLIGQSRFTFRVARTRVSHVLRFVILSLVGLTVSYWAVKLAPSPWMGTVITALAIPVLSFIVMSLWVFPESERLPATSQHSSADDRSAS